MSVEDVLAHFQRRGIRLYLSDDRQRLLADVRFATLTEQDRACIAEHRADILRHLRRQVFDHRYYRQLIIQRLDEAASYPVEWPCNAALQAALAAVWAALAEWDGPALERALEQFVDQCKEHSTCRAS